MSYKLKTGAAKSISSGKGSSSGGSTDVSGIKCILPMNYGGLGNRFFDQLSIDCDKILQVSTYQEVFSYYFL